MKRRPRVHVGTFDLVNHDGTRLIRAAVYVDPEALARRMGWAATRNKNGKATAQAGAVLVTAISLTKEAGQ